MTFSKRLLAAAALSLLGSAVLAQEASRDAGPQPSALNSRDPVRADALAALRQGALSGGEVSYVAPTRAATSTLTRAEVSAQARKAARQGLPSFGEGPDREVSTARMSTSHAVLAVAKPIRK